VRQGPTNGLTDVPGLRVGHATLRGAGALTGSTVILAPPQGAVAGVDVRGAAPGTRETDLLDPRRLVERLHAVLFTGGSAYGLAAADGVMRGLESAGVGYTLDAVPDVLVPIVPAAVVFDLGRGGSVDIRPDASTGLAAYTASAGPQGAGPVASGVVGAGTGAVAGGLKGGIGTASAVLSGEGVEGATVGALVVLNAAGSAVDPRTGELYGARFGLADEFARLRAPQAGELAEALRAGTLRSTVAGPAQATTLTVLGTDVTLTKAQCTQLAVMGADGLARAVRPAHTMVDGDTTFALSTARRPAAPLAGTHELLAVGADCVTRAIVYAMLAATSVRTPAGSWPSYATVLPSALRAAR
jgi:putative pantetheine hydrolase